MHQNTYLVKLRVRTTACTYIRAKRMLSAVRPALPAPPQIVQASGLYQQLGRGNFTVLKALQQQFWSAHFRTSMISAGRS